MIELRDWEDKVLFGAIAVLVVIAMAVIVFGMVAGAIVTKTREECLRHGWPEGVVGLGLNRYCIRQGVYGESIVRPLDWVREHCDKWGDCSD